jgi:hypothetical protein
MTHAASLYLVMHSVCWVCRSAPSTHVERDPQRPDDKATWRPVCESCKPRKARWLPVGREAGNSVGECA